MWTEKYRADTVWSDSFVLTYCQNTVICDPYTQHDFGIATYKRDTLEK